MVLILDTYFAQETVLSISTIPSFFVPIYKFLNDLYLSCISIHPNTKWLKNAIIGY